MSPKAKITLIIWWIIAFFVWWWFLLLSLLNNWTNTQTDIIWNKFKNTSNQKEIKYVKQENKQNNNWQNNNKQKDNWNNQQETIKKEKHTFTILTPNNLNSPLAWKLFNLKYKKETWWEFKVKYYSNIKDYKEKLIYKLATKSDDFDFAIIPSEWFQNTEQFSKLSFKLWNSAFQISSIFDYWFSYYLKDNKIKAIPFAIDPIVWFSFDKDISTNQTFMSWKQIILSDLNRLTKNWNIKSMPILLGYDNNYIKYIEKNNKVYFPVSKYITEYYKFKKERKGLELLKDFWQNITYKTFDFNLYRKYILKLKKKDICKWIYEKYCLLFDKKTKLVYWFMSDLKYFKTNWFKIFKLFKIKTTKLHTTTLAIWDNSEYPTRWWIIIINPNSKNINYMWKFLQAYIELWKNWELPFYKYMISPFLWANTIKNSKIKYFEQYIWRFIMFDKMWVWLKDNLDKKTLNYFKWDISLDILLK